MDTLDALHRFTLKIFAEPPGAVSPRAIIPIFHAWIRDQALDGLLIDVADYAHLPDGPGALLVGHDANLAIDGDDGRPGLVYSRKRASRGPLADRLVAGSRALLQAARLLERDRSAMPNGPFGFRGHEIAFSANDRLAAPNTDATRAALRPPLEQFGARLFGGAPVDIETAADASRVSLTITTAAAVSIDQLLDNLQ